MTDLERPILDVTEFRAWYDAENPIMSGNHFVVPPGNVVGLLGGNGAGKTTFIRGLTGLLSGWSSKSFLAQGRESFPKEKNFKSTRYAVYSEDRSFPLWTFKDLLGYLHSVYGKKINGSKINSLIEGFSFSPHVETRLSDLSSGNNKKARLICAFSLDLPLLILDEPVDFLDFTGTEFLYETIASYSHQGKSVFMSSHIAESFVRCCDIMYLLQDGELSGPFQVPDHAADVAHLLK